MTDNDIIARGRGEMGGAHSGIRIELTPDRTFLAVAWEGEDEDTRAVVTDDDVRRLGLELNVPTHAIEECLLAWRHYRGGARCGDDDV